MLKLYTSSKTWEKKFKKLNADIKVKDIDRAIEFIRESAIEFILTGKKDEMLDRMKKVFNPFHTPMAYLAVPNFISEIQPEFIIDYLLNSLISKGYFELQIKECSKITKKNAYKLKLIEDYINFLNKTYNEYKNINAYKELRAQMYRIKNIFYKECKDTKFFNSISSLGNCFIKDYNYNSSSYINAKKCLDNNGYYDLDNSSILEIENGFRNLVQNIFVNSVNEQLDIHSSTTETKEQVNSFLEKVTSNESLNQVLS